MYPSRAVLALVLALILAVALAAPAAAQVPVELIVKDGDTPPAAGGDPVTTLNAPFTNGLGQVGFTGAVDRGGSSDNFIWFDSGPIWFNSSAVGSTLSGAEGTMGVGNAGEFVYSPSVDGNDSVWTQNGLLLTEDVPAPGGSPGELNSFNSRPQLLPDGTALWVGGITDSPGGSTQARALYRAADTATPVITEVFRSGDMIGGFTIDFPSGVGFDYQISDDGNQHIHDLLMDTGSTTNDGFVYVNGALVAREADPVPGGGENWDNFDVMAINNAGNYLFSGDTDGSTATDEFIAYNGTIAIREGDLIDGHTLGSSVSAASLNNLGQAVFIWSTDLGETLFHALDASNLAGATALLTVGDSIDVDGNMTPDYTVTDFNASNIIGPGLSLAEDGSVYVEVDIDDGGGDLEAIIRLALPQPALPDIAVAPMAWDYGQVTVGATATQTFTVSNAGTADLSVTSTDLTGPDAVEFMITAGGGAFVLMPGDDRMIDVEFAPLVAGVKTADLEIVSDDPDTPLLIVPLDGEGVGVGGPGSVLEIPTLSPLGLAALVALLLVAGLLALRRRRAA